MDFGDVVVHIFKHDIREHYAIEKLWGDAPRVRLPGERPERSSPVRSPVKPRTSRVRHEG